MTTRLQRVLEFSVRSDLKYSTVIKFPVQKTQSRAMGSSLMPLKTHRVGRWMHVKSVKAQSNPVGEPTPSPFDLYAQECRNQDLYIQTVPGKCRNSPEDKQEKHGVSRDRVITPPSLRNTAMEGMNFRMAQDRETGDQKVHAYGYWTCGVPSFLRIQRIMMYIN
ncbi:hypothetical protein TNCV_1140921 [Trichonephila clavipes]|nr:hypothetical protein TNCV_1140921 [Trichonephila clavipes]